MRHIRELANWGEQKLVDTKAGRRLLRVAIPTGQFWQAWRKDQAELKAAGVSCRKDARTGQFQVCWWQAAGSDVAEAQVVSPDLFTQATAKPQPVQKPEPTPFITTALPPSESYERPKRTPETPTLGLCAQCGGEVQVRKYKVELMRQEWIVTECVPMRHYLGSYKGYRQDKKKVA